MHVCTCTYTHIEFMPEKQCLFIIQNYINVIKHINTLKKKIHISVNTENAFDTVGELFIILKKTLSKLRIERKFLKLIQCIYKHLKRNIFIGKILKVFSLRLEMR